MDLSPMIRRAIVLLPAPALPRRIILIELTIRRTGAERERNRALAGNRLVKHSNVQDCHFSLSILPEPPGCARHTSLQGRLRWRTPPYREIHI